MGEQSGRLTRTAPILFYRRRRFEGAVSVADGEGCPPKLRRRLRISPVGSMLAEVLVFGFRVKGRSRVTGSDECALARSSNRPALEEQQ